MKKTLSSASFAVLTFSSLVKKSIHRSECCSFTDSWNSGSQADASHRLFKMKIFGLDRRVDTSWKNDFSWKWRQKLLIDCESIFQKTYGQCHRRLSIQHQNEYVCIQAMVVDPIIQIRRNIHTGRIHKDDIISQQTASFTRPINSN